MSTVSRQYARMFGRQKPWKLCVFAGYSIALIGFIMLPSIILTPASPFFIAGGFLLSLTAYLTGRFRASARRSIRMHERHE